MKLDFTQALNKPNHKFDFTFEWEYNEGMKDSMPHESTGVGEVKCEYFAADDGVINLSIEVRVPFRFVCDKCGDAFSRNLYIVADEQIYPSTQQDYDGFTYDSNAEVDITEIASQVVLSAFPQRVLCKPNCKGLCSTCGVNLNYENCDCDKDKIGKNNPFGQLLGKIQ